MAIKLTPAFLDRLRGLAQNCQPPIWEVNEHSDVVSVAHTVAEVAYDEDAQFIAEANPATVLAMVEEIEILKTALNLLMSEYYSTDLEHEDIDKLCIGQIEIAKKHRKSEAGQ